MVQISFEKQKKGDRYNLYVDGEFYSGIEKYTILLHNLKNFQEIEKDKLEEIMLSSESEYAFNKALHYLAKCMKSEGEVIKYLKSKSFKDNVIEIAIKKLKEYRYIDDVLYTKEYIEMYKSKYGKLKIKQNLLNKCIDEELIDEYLSFDEEENLDSVINLIEKRTKNKEFDDKLKQKIIRNLLSKGYSYDIIKKAFKRIKSYEDWD